MNPFDLPGPAFLAVYAIVLVTLIVVAVLLRRSYQQPDDEPPDEALGLDAGCSVVRHGEALYRNRWHCERMRTSIN